MATFKQFLEAQDPYATSQVDHRDITEYLFDECSEMVKAYQETGIVLLRGIKEQGAGNRSPFVHVPPTAVKAQIRKDRMPVMMPKPAHDLLNKAMEELNLPTRGNSLFCTTNYFIADNWGPVYVLFVKDGWRGLVFDGIDKSEYAYDHVWEPAGDIATASSLSDKEKLKRMTEIIQGLEPQPFKAAGLSGVLREKYADILITGDSYYAIRCDSDDSPKLFKELGIREVKNARMLSTYKPTPRSLADALRAKKKREAGNEDL